MATQTLDVDLSLTAEGAGGVPVPVRLADLQTADPAAGAGALDSSVRAVETAVAALRSQLSVPIDVRLGAPVDVSDRPARQLGHVTVDALPAGLASEASLAALSAKVPAPHADGGLPAHVTNFPTFPATQAVSGPFLTDAQLRAAAVGVSGPLTDAQLRAAAVGVSGTVDVGNLPATQAVSGAVSVSNWPATQPVSLVNAPLPPGAATAARQDTEAGKLDDLIAKDYATETSLQALSGKVGTPAADDMLSLLRSIAANTLAETTKTDVLQLTADQVNLNTDQVEAKLDTVSARIGTTGVAGSAVERIEAVRAAIAGTPAVSVSNWPATQPVSAAALPLPAGAATAARQDTMNGLLGAGLPAALVGGRLDVNVGAMPNVTVSNFPASQAVTGTFWQATQPISAASLPLPTGAASEVTLAAINTKLAGTVTVDTELSAAGPLATESTQAAINTKLGNPLAVSQSGAWSVTVDTELPAAAALTDALDRATSTPVIGAAGLIDNGTNLVRVRQALAAHDVSYTGALGAVAMVNDAATTRPQIVFAPIGDGGNGKLQMPAAGVMYNGGASATGWDRVRNNVEGTALASAARTATTSSADITNYNGDGVMVVLRVSAIGTAPSLTLAVEAKDPVSGVYYALNATPTAVAAVGTYVYEIGEGASGAAGGGVTQRTAGQVPRVFRVTVTHGNANSVTYSVGYSIIMA